MENFELSEGLMRVGIFILVLSTMLVWEKKAPRRPVSNHLQRHRRINNLMLAVLNTLLARAIPALSAVFVAAWAADNQFGLLNQFSFPLGLSIILCVILLDLAIYTQHLVFHTVPILWRLHRVHHSDPEFDTTTALRFHPIEIILSMAIKCGLVALLGVPILAIILFEIILNASAMFNHGNVKLSSNVDIMLRKIIVTPDMHRSHHSTIPSETDQNFGFFLSIWDKIFGTYLKEPSLGHVAMNIGLKEYQHYKSTQKGGLIELVKQPWNSAKI